MTEVGQVNSSHLDVNNLLDADGTKDLKEPGGEQHLATFFAIEQNHDVVRIQVVHSGKQQRRQSHQDDTTDAAFPRQRFHLTENLETLADKATDLI